MTTRRKKVEVGSGNIFADLELPDAEDMLLKSTIVIELRRLIKQRKLTQSAAAKLIGESLHYGEGRVGFPGAVMRGGDWDGRLSLSWFTRSFCSALSSV
jgi:hypothetical protein